MLCTYIHLCISRHRNPSKSSQVQHSTNIHCTCTRTQPTTPTWFSRLYRHLHTQVALPFANLAWAGIAIGCGLVMENTRRPTELSWCTVYINNTYTYTCVICYVCNMIRTCTFSLALSAGLRCHWRWPHRRAAPKRTCLQVAASLSPHCKE